MFLVSNIIEKLEYNLISKTNIQELQRLEQNDFETEDQEYEIVPGFESLRNILFITIRT